LAGAETLEKKSELMPIFEDARLRGGGPVAAGVGVLRKESPADS
jgi:hypothetical protein